MVKVERHRLGPRVYLLGQRIHECALGLAVLAVLTAGCVAEAWGAGAGRVQAGAALGSWLVIKDWRDLFRSKRNTASWSPLLHRVRR